MTSTAQTKRNDLIARRVSFDPSVDCSGRDAGKRKGSEGVSSGVKGVWLGVKGTSKAEDEKNR